MAARGDNAIPGRADDHDDTPSPARPRSTNPREFWPPYRRALEIPIPVQPTTLSLRTRPGLRLGAGVCSATLGDGRCTDMALQ